MALACGGAAVATATRWHAPTGAWTCRCPGLSRRGSQLSTQNISSLPPRTLSRKCLFRLLYSGGVRFFVQIPYSRTDYCCLSLKLFARSDSLILCRRRVRAYRSHRGIIDKILLFKQGTISTLSRVLHFGRSTSRKTSLAKPAEGRALEPMRTNFTPPQLRAGPTGWPQCDAPRR